MEIEVYGSPYCKYCDKLKAFLTMEGVDYNYTEIRKPSDKGFKTVPQVYVDGRNIGGFIETVGYFRQKMVV